MGQDIEENNTENQVEVEYYYDYHSVPEEEIGNSAIHFELISYLMAVLKWLFRGQSCAIYSNLSLHQTADWKEHFIVPDIMVIKGVGYQWITSWKIPLMEGQAPHVVFEIASEELWNEDTEIRPHKYAALKVQEYFYYDPDDQAEFRHAYRRLIGWRFNAVTEKMEELLPDEQGRLWSEQLDCWLVPDKKFLCLYDHSLQICLTEAEATTQRAETLARRVEVLERQKEALTQRLHELGTNLDELQLGK